ncbi:MAG TPA: ATP-dependent helicase HrpB [Planctomycetaceae bacterium]|nr:ATP-dependent helicase HrpB [Planctomycetaceae bacterium]
MRAARIVTLSPLPIDAVLPQLTESLRAHGCAVVRAPTGSGKTTRVAPAVLDSGLAGERAIVVLEPRRVAARAAARRIAAERQGRVGDEIGYAVRFDQQLSRQTRIRIVTDGVLLRSLNDDPFLEDVSVVIFDEFHERGLNVDLALGMVRRVQQTVRSDLKIIVMSATLAAEPVAAFLGDCPIIVAEGRRFPVELAYIGTMTRGVRLPVSIGSTMHLVGGYNPFFNKLSLEGLVSAVRTALEHTSGDILVFLPGVGEIRRAATELAPLSHRFALAVMPLYGDLSAEQQDAVLGPSERRKVVLATNVAETSITIDGITAVVDTGLARVLRFDERAGFDRLVLSNISKASADQRAGRAGRTQPGIALRLWTEEQHQGRAPHDEPEIRRVDLAGPVLQLSCWGEVNAAGFPWFEPPRAASIAQAERLLSRLGALDEKGATDLGRLMNRLSVHPRLARLLIEGRRLGVARRAALAVALLSERSPFFQEDAPVKRRGRTSARSASDIVDRVAALEGFSDTGHDDHYQGTIKVGAARMVLRVRDQLLQQLEAACGTANPDDSATAPADEDEALQRCVLAAFHDRLARRREMSKDRGVMVGGRGVRLGWTSAVTEAELFVCVDVDAGDSEALVHQASAVAREWLDPRWLTSRDEVTFDRRSGRVAAVRRTCWDDLVLDEVSLAHIPDEQIAAALAAAAAADLDQVLPKDNDLRTYLERVRSLREWMPELQLPALDDAQLAALLPAVCQGCRSFDDVRRAPWLHWIKTMLTPAQLQAIDREAPERLSVPSGSRVAIQYKAGKRPVLAARIQELFGLAQTPRIAGGRVPLLMHLLAPNMRPQQVTDDLTSFWNKAYQQVRKDLRARYPKHAWPEDPWNALPQRRPGKK